MAFEKLSNDTIDDLLKPENKGKLTNILKYHLLSGNYTAADIKSMPLPKQLDTLANQKFIADISGNSLKVNDATVKTPDIFASNGMIHIIDTVLIPPTDIIQTAIDNTNFQTLVASLNETGLITMLQGPGPFTVFAPNDTAFDRLPEGVLDELRRPEGRDTLSKILRYHVAAKIYTTAFINHQPLPINITMLPGSTATLNKVDDDITINDVIISEADLFSSNGIIHSLDQLILPPLDIVEVALIDGSFKNLTALLRAANLTFTLEGDGPFTVFAPTDTAFSRLPAGTVDDLLKPENKEKLTNILIYHVLNGKTTSADIKAMTLPVQIDTLSGLKSIVDVDGNSVKVNAGTVTKADVSATNGIIHVIDTVLLPPTDIVETAVNDGQFKTLVDGIVASGLNKTLQGPGPYTMVGPTEDAFNKLPVGVWNELLKPENQDSLSKILSHHVTNGLYTDASLNRMSVPVNITMLDGNTVKVNRNGATVKIDDASISTPDIFNTNGMIHGIDSVVLPPLNVIETVITRGNFQIFIRALKAANLFDTFKGPGPYTIFAPTDDAFNQLPPGELDDLLKPENINRLIKTLQYHVLNGRTTAADIKAIKTLPAQLTTVSGVKFIADTNGNSVEINTATITQADLDSTNGLVHVIDTVLLLPTDIVETTIDNGNFKKLVNLLIAADLAGTLKGDGPYTVFAPTDAAFDKLPPGFVYELSKSDNIKVLAKILQYHVTNQLITNPSINRLPLPYSLDMLAGGTAQLNKDGTTIKINDASVDSSDIFNTNGMIHIIDTVLLPPLDVFEKIVMDGSFDTLARLIQLAGLADTLQENGPFTMFPPNDAAFAKLPNGTLDDLVKPENKDILINRLKYHIVNGQKLSSDDLDPSKPPTMFNGEMVNITKNGDEIRIDGVKIIAKNVPASNGIIHVIEDVLDSPMTPNPTPSPSAMSLHTSQTFLVLASTLLYVYRFLF